MRLFTFRYNILIKCVVFVCSLIQMPISLWFYWIYFSCIFCDMDDVYDILIKYEFNPGFIIRSCRINHSVKKKSRERAVTSFLQEQINGGMRYILLLTVIKFPWAIFHLVRSRIAKGNGWRRGRGAFGKSLERGTAVATRISLLMIWIILLYAELIVWQLALFLCHFSLNLCTQLL